MLGLGGSLGWLGFGDCIIPMEVLTKMKVLGFLFNIISFFSFTITIISTQHFITIHKNKINRMHIK